MYEAAEMDGAIGWKRVWHVTIPMLYPSFYTVTILAVGLMFGIFTEPYVLTGGGLEYATHTWQLEIYNQAFEKLNAGYGTAVAIINSIVTFANTYWAMILPKAVNLWAIFMYTNFFRSIPDELIEAAKMDGAGHFTIIRRIVWPMSRLITTIIFLFLFMERWVELLWDMLVVNNEKMLTLNVLLAQIRHKSPFPRWPGEASGFGGCRV
ncbi:hypothetical protein B4114_2797 [Geobacillus stearothermophilus]|uniref:ABC transmembrane type-1 domain-containing protein n=1 Tax=Geobacillus stearothermophilus TaxID=1422 RepID=A0A150ND54_GEOSE|nr:hypothetical protein B4114_2797 [Geobacillus stearothermophilus]